MKGKAKVFRFLLVAILTLTMVFVVAACKKNTDEADVAEAKEALTIGYTGADNENSVTQKLTLPTTGLKEVTITWTSSHPQVVSITGDVTRPAVDTVVTLTATLTKGEEDDTKEFIVKVIKAPVVTTPQEALDALEITGEDLEEEDGIYTTTQNVVLPTTSLGMAVNWESSSTAINVAGTVTRPAYGENNVRVILTAYIGSLEKEFIVDVIAIQVMPIAAVLSQAHTQLILASNEVVENITLPTAIVVEGVHGELYTTSVTWVSSDTSHISNAGVVTRPGLEDPDVIVTLTATITFENQTTTKTIQIRVLAESEPYEEFDTFLEAEAYFLDDIDGEAERRYVKIFNVSVIGRMDDGLMFVDSEGSVFFAFGSSSNAYRNAEQGKLYDVIGNLAYYFGVTQINGTGSAFSRQPTILIEKEGDPVTVEPTVVEHLTDLLPEEMPTYSLTNMIHMEYLTLDAKIYVKSTLDDYGVFLLDVDYDGDFTDIDANSSPKTPYNNLGVVVYYTSNKNALIPLNGLTVTIDVVLYGLRDDRNIYNVAFLGEIEDIIIHEMTDAQAVAAVKQSLDMTTPRQFPAAGTISLPSELLGTEIVWTSDNEDVISTDGTVTPVAGERIAVKLTAVISMGEEEDTLEITVMVGELPILTVEEALEIEHTDNIKVKGTIVGFSANNTVVLHDETGAIAIFIGGATSSDIADLIKGAIGQVVILEGSRTSYGGLEQIQNIVDVVITTEQAHIEKVDITELAWTAEVLLPHQSKLVSIVDGTVTNVSIDQYNNVAVTITLGEKSIVIRWDSRVALTGGVNVLATAVVGDIINVIDAPLGWTSNNPQIGYYVSGQVTLEADPSLERFDVIFMDGEEEVEAIEVVEGRIILEYPPMFKELFIFTGWFTDEELTQEWDLEAAVEEDLILYAGWVEIEVYSHFTFGSIAQTGYSQGTLEFEGITISKDRVQINVSGFAPHTDNEPMLVFAPINTVNRAYAIFDFSGEEYEGLNRISFALAAWSYGGGTPSFEKIKTLANPRFTVEVLDGETWKVIKTIELKTTLKFEEYVTIYVDTEFGAAEYRISYIAEDAASGNTTQAAVLDDLKLYREVVVYENPVTISFLSEEEVYSETVIESGTAVKAPTNPTRAGFNFLGWALEGETDLYNFEELVTEDIVLVAQWVAVEELTIAEVKQATAGTWVKITGVVTGFTEFTSYGNRDYVYIQDETGAILLYRAAIETLAVGDVYEVVGKLAIFNGLFQIDPVGAIYTPSEEVIAVPDPIVVTDLEVLDVDYQSLRISFEAVVKSVSANGQSLVVTVDEVDITIRSSSSQSTNPINAHLLTAEVGQTVSVVGIYVGWYNGAQLVPYTVEEVVFVPLTDEQKVALDKAALILLETYTTEFTLPVLGAKGSTITWTADPEANLVDGKLVIPEEGEVTVTLTATLTLGEETDTKVFEVVLKVAGEEENDPIEITAEYPGGSTTNMKAGNNAETLGLDETIFTVTSIERSPNPLHIGLNTAGQIRLYNATDFGNTLSISIAEGYTITNVEFVFGATVTSAKIMTGTDIQFEGALTANSTLSYEELDVDTFSIENIGTAQIYILQIKITYIPS
ncbi:MAG: immunoglobulin-like domain-containing protein [Acholeplasmataceae bacterium]